MCRAPGSRRKVAARVDTQTVRVRRVRYFFRTRVSCTGRAREKQSARVFNTGRVREACNFHLPHMGQQHGPCPLVSVARVSSTGRVRDFQCSTGRADQHGPCPKFGLHGSRLALHGACSRFLVLHGACDLARVKLGFARVVQFSLL